MTPAALVALFRATVRDEAEPYLWSDAEIFAYIDDAQKQFCRLGGGIPDSTSPEVTQVSIAAGDEYAAYDPRILKLRDVRRVSDGHAVTILNFEDLSGGKLDADYGFTIGASTKFPVRKGPIKHVVVGMEQNKLRLVETPEEDDVLQYIVYRLPLKPIDKDSTEFEVDERHHYHLLNWVLHLAFKKLDAETYDRGKSEEFGAIFYQYCEQTRTEQGRREHKYRTVRYGGL